VSARKPASNPRTIHPVSTRPPASCYRCSMIFFEHLCPLLRETRCNRHFPQRDLTASLKTRAVCSQPQLPYLYHGLGGSSFKQMHRGSLLCDSLGPESHATPLPG
jgi:hypothetical protein